MVRLRSSGALAGQDVPGDAGRLLGPDALDLADPAHDRVDLGERLPDVLVVPADAVARNLLEALEALVQGRMLGLAGLQVGGQLAVPALRGLDLPGVLHD